MEGDEEPHHYYTRDSDGDDNNDADIEHRGRRTVGHRASDIQFLFYPYSDATGARFPFLRYSADYWHVHFEASTCMEDEDLVPYAVALCTLGYGVFRNVFRAQKLHKETWVRCVALRDALSARLCIATAMNCIALVRIMLRIDEPDLYTVTEILNTAIEKHLPAVGNVLLDYAIAMNCSHLYYPRLLAPAVAFDRLDLVMKFLESGIDPNYSDKISTTLPLVEAVRSSNAKLVTVLLNHYADPNHISFKQEFALSVVDDIEILMALLEQGADPDVLDTWDRTPLQSATEQGSVEMVIAILNHKSNVDLRNISGDTALLIAAREGHQNILRLLLQSNADPNLSDSNGETPLHKAAQLGLTEIVMDLLDYKSNVNAQNMYGRTALFMAAAKGHQEIVHLLLQHNADPMLKDTNNSIAEDVAANLGHALVAALLPKRVIKKRASLSDLWPLKPFWELQENTRGYHFINIQQDPTAASPTKTTKTQLLGCSIGNKR